MDPILMDPFDYYEFVYSRNRKVFVTYTLACLFIALLLGCICLMGNAVLWIKLLQLSVFVAAGYIHVKSMRKIHFLNPHVQLQGILTLIISFLLFLFLFLLYLVINSNLLIMALASSCAFGLPFLLLQSWASYISIPEQQYKLWYYSETPATDKGVIYLGNMTMQFKVLNSYMKYGEKLKPVIAPGRMKLGNVFYHFLKHQKNTDEYSAEYKEQYHHSFGWSFYVEYLGGWNKRYLDPELTLTENGLKENSSIVARPVEREPDQNA